jgi:hypothetical protein
MHRFILNGVSLGFGILLGMLVMAMARPEQPRRVKPCPSASFHHSPRQR